MDAIPATRAGRRPVVAAMLVSTFMAATEVTIISTAMPTIVARLGGFDLFTWAFGIFLLAQAVTTPLYGRLADLFGRRRTYLGCTALFLAGSVLCGLAWSMPSLIVFRAVQGLGGGGLIPLGTIIVSDVTAPEDRPRALSHISVIWGVAAIAGPLLGSLCVGTLGWPFVFWINLPVGAVSMALVVRYLPDPVGERAPGGLDGLTSALLAGGIGTGMEALIQWQTLPLRLLAALLATSLACLAWFAWRERGAAEAILPMHLLRQRLNLAANVNGLLSGALLIATTAFVPTWVQGVAGHSALAAGLVLGVETVGWTATSFALGRVLGRLQSRRVALCSTALMVVGTAGLLLLGRSDFGLLLATSALLGAGLGSSSLVFTVAVQSGSSYADRGRATSLFYFCRLLGQAVGSAAFGGVMNFGLQRAGSRTEALQDLLDPVRRGGLPDGVRGPLVATLNHALHGVFLMAVAVAGLALLAAVIVPRSAASSTPGLAPAP